MDIFCEWNGDLIITPNGSIQSAVGWDNVRERIIRNMITNSAQTLPDGTTTPPDYVFDPSFGIGMGTMVDGNFTPQFIATLKQKTSQAVFSDADINPGVPPSIVIKQPDPSTLSVYISVQTITGQDGQIQVSLA